MSYLKKLAVVGAVLCAAFFFMGQAGKPGHGGAHGQPGVGILDDATAEAILDTAIALWSFNDTTDLGNDDSGNAHHLTLVNTPTATGGALGYSLQTAAGSSQQATIDDNASTSQGTNTSFGFCIWVRPTAVIGTYNWFLDKNAEYELYLTNGDNWVFRLQDSVSGSSTAELSTADYDNSGKRYLMCGWYDSSDKKAHFSLDDGTPVLGVAITNNPADGAFVFRVFGRQAGSLFMTGEGSSLTYWKGGTPDVTTLYNSGKGQACAETSTTNLESCWDFDEDGGPYVDDIGSNNLTGVNTPTRAEGLVERSDSGMSLKGDGYLVGTTDDDFWDLAFNTSHSFAVWYHSTTAGNAEQLFNFNETGAQLFQASIRGVANNVQCILRDTTGNKTADTAGGVAIDNEWQLLVCTYDSADHKVRLSIDGATFVVSAALTGDLRNAGDVQQFRLPSASPLANAIDNAAFWNDQALTQDQVTTLWASGAGTFYAAFLDMIFNGPRFAWSAPPEIKRITWN